MARSLGVPATAVVPDTAAPDKVAAIQRLGGRVVRLPWDEWWSAVSSSDDDRFRRKDIQGLFIHQFQDPAVMAGNGTIGLELVEQLESVDSVLIPWGGGGLCTGIASALDALTPATKVFVCEPETGAPLSASLDSGAPTSVEYTPSFVDGAGAGAVLPTMWEHAKPLVDASFAITLRDAANALRLLLERSKIVVEGAAALTVAAALAGNAGSGRVVCILSGGNISAERLRAVLGGRIPK
jgi:threonine dehydratase